MRKFSVTVICGETEQHFHLRVCSPFGLHADGHTKKMPHSPTHRHNSCQDVVHEEMSTAYSDNGAESLVSRSFAATFDAEAVGVVVQRELQSGRTGRAVMWRCLL